MSAVAAPARGADALANPAHEHFARLVAGGMSHGAAYKQAGYSSKSPEAHGHRLANSGSVKERITFLRDQQAAAAVLAATVDSGRIQQELEHLAFSDIGQAFEEARSHDGLIVPRALPITRWPVSLRRAVSKVKVKRYLEGSGDTAREVELIEFGLWPKVPALQQLREHMGLVKPIEVDHTVRGVIALPVMQVPVPGPGDRVIDVDVDVTPDEVEDRAPPPREETPLDRARRALLEALNPPRNQVAPR